MKHNGLRRARTVFYLIIGVAYAATVDVYGQTSVAMQKVRENPADQINFASPNAYAFAKYVVNPVSYYTGIPQISIPLYAIQLKDFTFPIDLTYHAGGFKVEEVSSNIGLGWNLSAYGVITRSVKDIADDAAINECSNVWFQNANTQQPPGIARNNNCGNGLLWALAEPVNANYDGLQSYDVNLDGYNGLPNTAQYSMKLLKKFYGVAQYADKNDLYLLKMADKEPDIFYFNFTGHTGQFIFDMSSGTPVIRTYPYQDLKIEHILAPGTKRIGSFKVTDEKGIVYTFAATEVTTTNFTANTTAPVDDNLLEGGGLTNHVLTYETGSGLTKYTSSWFLSRIETPLGEYLDFTYADEDSQIANRGPQQTALSYIRPSQGAMNYNPNALSADGKSLDKGFYNCLFSNTTTLAGKRISTIENNTIKVVFSASAIRQDVDTVGTGSAFPKYNKPYAIDGLTVSTKIGGERRIKKVAFVQDYFLSDTAEPINKAYTINSDYYTIDVAHQAFYYKRLRLRSIQEFGQNDIIKNPTYIFQYKYYDFTGANSHKLPHRLSLQQDVWGYYNGASGNNTLIPSQYVYPSHYPVKDSRQFRVFKKTSYTGSEYYLPAANRLPNGTYTDIGLLSKVIYPSGGSDTYEFESNTFRNEGEDYTGGGLRIKRISKNDGSSTVNDIIHNYAYQNNDNTSSGCLVSMPVFATRSIPNIFGLTENSELAYKSLTVRYSVPQATLGSTNGSFIGYRTVTDYQEGQGKTVFTFSMPAAWYVENDIPNSTPGGVCDPLVDGYCDGLYSLTPVKDIFISDYSSGITASTYNFNQNPAAPNTMPFADNPNYDWQRGYLLSERVYNESVSLLKETLYTYKNYFPDGKTTPTIVFGYKMSYHYPVSKTGYFLASYSFRFAKYSMLTEVGKVLDTKREILYDNTKKISTDISFSYENLKYNEPTLTVSTDSQGRVIKNVRKFATDLSLNDLGSDLLKTKHIHHIPLRQTTSINDIPVKKIEASYTTSNGVVMPSKLVNYVDDSNMLDISLFNYDANGNLQQVTPVYEEDSNGVAKFVGNQTSYLWGYGNTYSIAKVENAKLTDVFYTGFEDGDGNSTYNNCKTGHLSKTGGYSKTLTSLTNGLYWLTYWQNDNGVWTLQQSSITVTSNSYAITIDVAKQIDDIRFYPSNALLSTYTYDPLIGMTSATDTNNSIIYYEYDLLNRLQLVRDKDSNIIKQIDYHYVVIR